MGMVDRGADISWLSQYPHEREILFAPLASLELRATRVEGRVLVVEVRANINLSALTIEQVVAKRHNLISSMGGGIKAELHADLARDLCPFPKGPARGFQVAIEHDVLQNAPVSFNNDARFGSAVNDILGAKKRVKQVVRDVRELCDARGTPFAQATSIDLTNMQLGPVGGTILAEWIREHASLTHLGLYGTGVGDDGVADLTSMLEEHPSLTSLDLRNTGVTERGGIDALGNVLLRRTGPAMRCLMLDECTMDAATASLKFKRNISGTPMGKVVVSVVRGLLGGDNSLQTIHVDLCSLPIKKLTGVNPVQELDLESKCADCSAIVIGKCLEANSSLTSLDLSTRMSGGYDTRRINICDEGAKALGAGLTAGCPLANLDLTGNDIQDEGAKGLAAGLTASRSLANLILTANEIKDEGAKALAIGVAASRSLRVLHLACNFRITEEGVKALGAGVAASISLTELMLNGIKVGDEGAKALAAGMAACSSLAKLILHGCELRDEGAKALAAGLAESSSMTSCEIEESNGCLFGLEPAKMLAKVATEKHVMLYFDKDEKEAFLSGVFNSSDAVLIASDVAVSRSLMKLGVSNVFRDEALVAICKSKGVELNPYCI